MVLFGFFKPLGVPPCRLCDEGFLPLDEGFLLPLPLEREERRGLGVWLELAGTGDSRELVFLPHAAHG